MFQSIPIEKIVLGSRLRKELGDIPALAESIRELGLLQPIGVTSGMQLVWGLRRLKACQHLGWRDIPAVVDPSLDDIARAMEAEKAENLCRLPFTPEEEIAIANQVEDLEKQRAEERQKATQAKPGDKLRTGEVPSRNGGADSAPPFKTQIGGKTRDKVAEAVGTGHDRLSKARKVMAEGTPELIDAMNQREVSVHAAAQLAALPPDQQRQLLAGDKKNLAKTVAKLRPPRRPGLLKAFEQLERLAKLPRMNLSMIALREAVDDLRKELGALLS